MPTSLTNEEISEAFEAVRRLIHKEFPPGLRRDYAIDRATTAFMNCLKKFRPREGLPNSFTGFALKCVGRSLIQVHSKRITTFSSAGIDQVSRDQRQTLNPPRFTFDDFEFLPPSIQKVMYLRFCLGFTLVDVGLLSGLGHQSVQKQIVEGLRTIEA